MAASKAASPSSSSFPKFFFVYLISLSVAPLLLLLLSLQPTTFRAITTTASTHRLSSHHQGQRAENPTWFDLIRREFEDGKKIKVGLVNIGAREDGDDDVVLQPLSAKLIQTVSVSFDHVNENLTWNDFFPWLVDEGETSKCPDMPMPELKDYRGLDVVVARIPCRNGTADQMQGIRDVFRLQVNLVVAKLLVESGWLAPEVARKVYAVFIGSCGPMVEIFRCDDLMVHHGDFWIYRPELGRLKQKVLMPSGSCQLATGYAKIGNEGWRPHVLETRLWKPQNLQMRRNKREAYVTVLHSSEAYVCGAIVLAQSIRQTKSHKDLVLLADYSITTKSIRGLKAAGWKVKRIHRIRCPFAQKGAYNEWNYSKLRVWELVEYDKIIFIDADLLVLNYIDNFFTHPELSAAANDKSLFNSGLMVIEPSKCMFEDLMLKSFELGSYNGGDQGFLNEVFTWWHRLPSSLNRLKYFYDDNRDIPNEAHTIHYLGLKPWMCYKDYDCNWDLVSRNQFASDSVHRKWWQVHDAMPSHLKPYCGLTKKMDDNLKLWRRSARNSSLPNGHWKIEIKDPRQNRQVKQ